VRRPAVTWPTLVLGAVALAGLFAVPAAAHTALVASDPRDGATLTRAPEAVVLTFDEDVTSTGTAMVVTGPDGARLDRPDGLLVSGPRVSVPLAAATLSGPCRVEYRVVSADGHVVTGQVDYRLVLAGSGSSSPTAPASNGVGPTPSVSPSASEGGTRLAPWGALVAVVAVAAVTLALTLGAARQTRARARRD